MILLARFRKILLLMSLQLFPILVFAQDQRPNILLCIADDWGWPYAGVYGDKAVRTPAFDNLAKNGMLFNQAFVSSPSCTPSRGAILAGQHFYRLRQGANLWSTLDMDIPVYPLLLKNVGYFIGHWRKAWGPGDIRAGGYVNEYPVGQEYKKGFEDFMKAKPKDQPFCFWLGSSDPHRPYAKGSGARSGIDIFKIKLPYFYPESDEIRSDIADYFYEVQRFDNDVAKAIALLRRYGELENTIIVVTGDHGMPFPRCKANLYDMGTRVPLVISWPARIKKGQVFDGLVSLTDLAPTFLEAAGADIPKQVTGRSLYQTIQKGNLKNDENERSSVIMGRERHGLAQGNPSIEGYPSRAIRNHDYLLIKNYRSDRWPAGVSSNSTMAAKSAHTDCDDGPTKNLLVDKQTKPEIRPFYELAFAKRPEIELYELRTDPLQIKNLADHPDYQDIKMQLHKKLETELFNTADPRMFSDYPGFDGYPFRRGNVMYNR